MGREFLDQYSLLHFATGVVAYFLGFRLDVWLLGHIFFEWVENTEVGMKIINEYLDWFWPGGKSFADARVNSFGDTVFTVMGWSCAKFADGFYNDPR